MRRRIVLGLLTLGVLAGYGSGIARLVHAHDHCHTHAPSTECAHP